MLNASVASAQVRVANEWPVTSVGSDHEQARRAEDRQFAAMQRTFVDTGGIVTGDQLVDLLRKRASQPISVLARWIVAREVVSISSRGHLLIPLFQFDARSMELLACMPPILGELVGSFDDWELAQWFATPNAWTDDVAPAEMVFHDGRAVLEAARCDRFLLRG